MTHRALIVAFTATTMILAGKIPAPGQDSPPITFRSEIDYVEIDARVLDRQGQIVRDLQQADFEILEDGRRQRIEVFAFVDIPFEPPTDAVLAGDIVSSDVVSNTTAVDGRVYLLVLDSNQMSGEGALHVRRIARQFVETRLAANDRAAVIATRGTASQNHTFTHDRRRLLAAIDAFTTAPWGGSLQEQTLITLRVLQSGAEFLAGVRGRRKALVFFSEGPLMDLRDYQLYARDAIAAATRHNVSIYAIHPGGMDPPAVDASTPPSAEPILQSGQRGSTEVEIPRGITIDNSRTPQWNLRTLAEETGGFAAYNTSNFAGAFDRIVADSSAYYLLGYRPSERRRDGVTRRVEVRVRRSDARVVARRGYIEPRGTVSQRTTGPGSPRTDPLADAMSAPLPTSGLSLAATAAVFRGTPEAASILVVADVPGDDLRLTEDHGIHRGTLDLWTGAIDRTGELRSGQHHHLDFALDPEAYAQVRAFGLRVLTRLELSPGPYQIRVGGRIRDPQTIGTVFSDVDVPDFAASRIAMSDLVLTSRDADRARIAGETPEWTVALPAPSTQRVFATGDELTVFAEVYARSSLPPEIATSVMNEGGRIVLLADGSRVQEERPDDLSRHRYRANIPLWTLAPGRYLLKVDAHSGSASRESTHRLVPFRIRN